ncbi:proline-, glutamic acid- and leucine-rich protein 1-like [Daktulosphaira vitifoliae]|uniref:proline-, glutamic acid- and leucine-rich protein 1-like n=1 Tax=Daktulosphaira vitifoliae TaxID=58002 RepID=UPI0021A9FB61|nr:proline-, glutamic acid- and leucine-rich protein 1-like [Daktulosphaira vitifoliae]
MDSKIASLKANEAVNWFQKNLKNCIIYGLSTGDYNLLEVFITSTITDVDIKKQLTSSVLPKFFENLASSSTNETIVNSQISIIRLCMKYYGSTCGQFKNILEKFTFKIISEYSNDNKIMVKLTKYLALYPQCGGRGQQGSLHIEAWTNQFNDFLYCANYFLHQLYSNVDFFIRLYPNDKYEGKFDISCFNISQLEQMSPKERYQRLTTIFEFFNTALQSMLLSMFSNVKKFDANKVIQFSLSVISVSSEKLKSLSVTEDILALENVLYKLHCSAMKTILALIKCCGRILIPQGVSICRFLIQSLNTTNIQNNQWIYGTNKSNVEQRLLSYKVLLAWMSVAGSQSSLEMFIENLISSILIDIKYVKPSINLIVNKQIGNKKRKSGALNAKIIDQRDTIVMHNYHANSTICNQAHEIIRLLLNTFTSNLKQLQFKVLQSTIMGLLLEVVKCQRPNEYPLPYYNDLCRMSLFNTLLALVISPHPQCVTQTSVAIRLFTLGLSDRNENVKEVCRSAIAKVEHIIHPRNDTLFLPLENEIELLPENQNVLQENQSHFLKEIEINNVVSEKNSVESEYNNVDNIRGCSPTKYLSNSKNKNNLLDNKISSDVKSNIEENSEKYIQSFQSKLADEVNEENHNFNNFETQQTNKNDVSMEVEYIKPINNLKQTLDKNNKDEEVIDMLNDFVDSS